MNIAISTAAPAPSATPAPSVSKSEILGALRKILRSRPGLEFANYGDLAAYRSDYRRINRQLNDGEILLAAVAWRDHITADHLLAELNGCGRLCWENGALHYTAGQYYPIEYRGRRLPGPGWPALGFLAPGRLEPAQCRKGQFRPWYLRSVF